jgi:hypothetical protein
MIQVIDVEQGTPEWKAARAGMPTASMFKDALAKGEGKTRRTYMLKLIGERLTGELSEGYSNGHMERGTEMEPEARDAYAWHADVEPVQVGFVVNDGLIDLGPVGCSPDSMIGEAGLLEIKTKLPHIQCEVLLKGEVPTEHLKQIHGAIWVCEREWLDFVSYWPGLPTFIKRVYRDEKVIAELKAGLSDFYSELLELEQQIRSKYA